MTYYNTPDPNDLRHPDEDYTCAETARNESSAVLPNFSSAIAAYADVPESSESDWLQYGSPTSDEVDNYTPTVLGDNWDDIPF